MNTTTQNVIVKKVKVLNVTLEELTTVLKETEIVNEIATFSSILQMTTPKCTKNVRDEFNIINGKKTKVAFLGTIEKLSSLSMILNSKYESGVLNGLKKEGKDKEAYQKGKNTMPLIKGENNLFFGTFNDKAVIEYRQNTNSNLSVKTRWFLNGKEIEKSLLPNVLPIPRKATNQGTDKEILWRKLYVSNIVEITLNGVLYKRIANK